MVSTLVSLPPSYRPVPTHNFGSCYTLENRNILRILTKNLNLTSQSTAEFRAVLDLSLRPPSSPKYATVTVFKSREAYRQVMAMLASAPGALEPLLR